MANLDEIKKRLSAITASPWHVENAANKRKEWHGRANIYAEPYPVYFKSGPRKGELRKMATVPIVVDFIGIGACEEDDAIFIASAPTDLEWCIKRIDDLENLLRQANEFIEYRYKVFSRKV